MKKKVTATIMFLLIGFPCFAKTPTSINETCYKLAKLATDSFSCGYNNGIACYYELQKIINPNTTSEAENLVNKLMLSSCLLGVKARKTQMDGNKIRQELGIRVFNWCIKTFSDERL